MKKRYLFSHGLILMLACCAITVFAQAQDSGKTHPVKTSQTKKIPTTEDDAFTPTLPSRAKKDTARPKNNTGAVKPAAKKDTIKPSKKADTQKHKLQVPLNPVAGDSQAHRVIRTIPAGFGDSGRVSRAPSTAVADTGQAILAPALPSFTKDSFDNYRAFVGYLMAHNSVFHPSDTVTRDIVSLRGATQAQQTDLYSNIFYIILGIVFLLAVFRMAFTKYFSDLFRAFFNPTLSQRQLREQLSQTPFPSLMLNLFFTLSAGVYLFLVLLHYHYFAVSHPLYLIPVFTGLIIVIYLIKYLFLRFAGWLFGYQDMAAAYAFTLNMINKVLGVVLLPFIFILAFSPADIADAALNISLILIVLLFIYRYVRIYGMARNQVFFQKFHFFVYLCGFEIAPILIVGKLVLIWLNGA